MNQVDRRRIRPWAGVAVVAVAGLVAVGCGSSSKSSNAKAPETTTTAKAASGVAEAKAFVSSHSAAPTSISITTPVKTKPAAGKKIVYVQCGVPVCTTIATGIQAAADAVGWSVTKVDMGTTAEQIQAAWDHVVQLKPDGVIAAGVPVIAYAKQLAQLKAAGIPYIAASTTDPVGNGVTAMINGSESAALSGKYLANWAVADSNGKASAQVFNVPDFPWLVVLQKAFDSELKRLCPDCKADDVNVAATDIGKDLPSRVVSAVQQNPDTNYLMFTFANMTLGVPAALHSAGLNSKVKVVESGGGKTNFKDMAAGDETAAVVNDITESGWQMVDALIRAFNGEPEPQAQYDQSSRYIMTKANAADPTKELTVVADYQAQYKKLWQLAG